MDETTVEIEGVRVPRFLYGTAWKEDDTERLTRLAVDVGFRGIDTANQRKHYHEAGVGRAVAGRGDLFLQTKFTFRGGQDDRLPYDPAAPIAEQVAQSFASSLDHLGVATIDSYLLHGPTRRVGLAADDWAAWRAMEALHAAGRVRLLGVSNVSLDQLAALCAGARVRPRFVQNRCYASRGWDRDVRAFCAANGVAYQGFSLLTANPGVLADARLLRLAAKYGRTPAQVVFRFALDAGMIPLTGTTDPAHMREGLDAFAFRLDPAEVELVDGLAS